MAGLLWAIMLVALALLVANRSFLGTAQPIWPTAFLALFVAGGLWLVRRGQLQLAVGLANASLFVSATIPIWRFGITEASTSLMLYFLPLGLAGLVLDRLRLFFTAIGTILAVLMALFLQYFELAGTASGPLNSSTWLLAAEFMIPYAILYVIVDRFGQSTSAALARATSYARSLEGEITVRQQVESELADERNFSETIIDSLPGVFFVMDSSGRIVRGNSNIQDRLGFDRETVVSQQLSDFVEPGDHGLLRDSLRQADLEGSAGATLTMRQVDGSTAPYFFRASRFSMRRDPYLLALGFDLSEVTDARLKVERLYLQLHDRVERLTALRHIDSAITRGLDTAQIIDVLLRQVSERLKVDAAGLLRFDRTSNRLRWQAGLGFRGAGLAGAELELGEGVAGGVAISRRNRWLHGSQRIDEEYVRAPLIRDEGFEFYVAVPLLANDELEGVLEIFHREDFRPSNDWSDFMDALATQAALVLNHARMLEDLEQSNLELTQAYNTTIEGWSRALDLRDEETEGHSRRVAELTVALARRMGASEERIVHLRRGALLHDIGKMGVPDGVLLKPGKLTPEERKQMELHTTHALKLLQPIKFLQQALHIPYCHHENWDGTGYPQGLSGTDIPLAARIFSVVDVYDALTNDRPYRKAWDEERALEYIREQSGRMFDPQVVTAFLEMLQEERTDRTV